MQPVSPLNVSAPPISNNFTGTTSRLSRQHTQRRCTSNDNLPGARGGPAGSGPGPDININDIDYNVATGGGVAAAGAGFTGFGAGNGGNAIVTDTKGGISHGAGEGVNKALQSVEGKAGTPGLHGHQQQMLDAMKQQGATAQQQEQAAAMMKYQRSGEQTAR